MPRGSNPALLPAGGFQRGSSAACGPVLAPLPSPPSVFTLGLSGAARQGPRPNQQPAARLSIATSNLSGPFQQRALDPGGWNPGDHVSRPPACPLALAAADKGRARPTYWRFFQQPGEKCTPAPRPGQAKERPNHHSRVKSSLSREPSEAHPTHPPTLPPRKNSAF